MIYGKTVKKTGRYIDYSLCFKQIWWFYTLELYTFICFTIMESMCFVKSTVAIFYLNLQIWLLNRIFTEVYQKLNSSHITIVCVVATETIYEQACKYAANMRMRKIKQTCWGFFISFQIYQRRLWVQSNSWIVWLLFILNQRPSSSWNTIQAASRVRIHYTFNYFIIYYQIIYSYNPY